MRVALLALFLAAAPASAAEPPKLKLLFLGDSAGHQPATRFKILQPVFAARNIDLTYTDTLDDLNPKTLAIYDGLLIYANHTKIAPAQEKALLDFVASGKGFIPVHCASYCFLNSDDYVKLVGAQFRTHGDGAFRTTLANADHAITKGYQPFTSWDETYVHTKHNEKGRTVLEVRAEGDLQEPWTWVRTHGKGRVFYTAWGHDHRTWEHPGFQNLLERGVRWACGQDPALAGSYSDKPEITKLRTDVKPFEYVPAKIPFYAPPGGKVAGPSRMQKPLSVEESVKHFVTPVDFEIKVFVTEEKLGGKPIAMNWDEQGRLWVSLTQDYPNEMQKPGEGRDRIAICEDTDGDGVCDKVTTFADKLSIPTSLLPYAGGVIVHQAPVTLFLKDTDGDGKADLRVELLNGWATYDTHAGPSNLHYGFDNWIYGAVGYAGFDGVVNGKRVSFKQGFYRFKLESGERPGLPRPSLKVTELEFLRSTSNNTWGLAFDESGQLFGSTANGCPIVHMPIPNRYYEKVKGLTPTVLQNIAPDNHIEPITEKIRQVDFHGGFTAASNIAIYTARTYPKEYWNRAAFVSEPTGHLTATFALTPDGASYKARYGWNLVASDDEWSAPIDAQVGPDGHMWVLDWYNFIVQHNPTPNGFDKGNGNAYETSLRDKTHGRIYRVVYTKAKPEPRVNLKDATPEKLVETLKHHNLGWRLHAQRLLVERGKTDVLAALADLVSDQGTDETELNAGAVHAVWTAAGLRTGADPETARVIRIGRVHESPAVRRTVLQATDDPKLIAGSPFDPLDSEPRLRFTRLIRMAEIEPSDEAASRLCADLFHDPTRTPLNSLQWEPEFDKGWSPAERDARLMACDRHAEAMFRFLMRNGMAAGLPPDRVYRFLEAVAKTAAARDPKLAERTLANCDHPSIRADKELTAGRRGVLRPLFAGFASGLPNDRKQDLTRFGQRSLTFWLSVAEPADRAVLLKLASRFNTTGLEPEFAKLGEQLLATVADAKAAEAERVEAARQIVEFKPDDDAAAEKLLAAVTPQTSPAVAAGIFEALGQSKAKGVGTAVVAKLKDLGPAARPAAVRLVLAKPDSAKAFLDAVEKGTLRFDLLALDQKTALASHPEKSIADRAQKLLALGGGLPSPDRQKVIEEFLPLTKKTGDTASGKKVFTAQCAKCHQYAGEGTNIGPDLTGMAVHPKEELLIHILDPSRSVEGNFKAYRLVTTDDRVIVGILGATTGTSVEIIDGEAKRHALSKDDIASLKETDKSLMPEGFEKQVKPEEIMDLLEFLTQKGKFVPLPFAKIATVVSTKDMFFDSGGISERLIFPDWKPKAFAGVPFVLVDPLGDKVKNVVMLNGPQGKVPPTMPKSVSLPYGGKVKAVHLLSGVGGWNAQRPRNGPVSMIVRLTYDDGKTEDHPLRDGVHFADYIKRVDVPESKFAFALRGQQIRYLKVESKRPDAVVKTIEFVKGSDATAPVVMAATVESP